jgi:hypothetical protein
VGRLVKIGVIGGALAWLASIGALDPQLWKDTIARERERIPDQLREALAAGRRAAAAAEEELDREVRTAFGGDG